MPEDDNIKFSIIIPTLNEKKNVLILLDKIETLFSKDVEIIVVDEHSPDGTYQAVCEYAKDKPYINCVLNTDTPGLSPSVVKGFDMAKGEYVCCMDGDLQHDPIFLTNLFKEIENNDMLIGSRYVEGGGFSDRWNALRKIISRSANLLTKLLLHINIKDPMSGFFLLRTELYKSIRKDLNPCGFKIMLEILFHLKQKYPDAQVKEIGIFFRNRQFGKSKLTSKVVFQFLKMLFELSAQKKKKKGDGKK